LNNFRNLALWIIIALLLVALFNLFQSPNQGNGRVEIMYSEFSQQLNEGAVRDVTIRGSQVDGTFADSRRFRTIVPPDTANLTARLEEQNVQINVLDSEAEMSPVVSVLVNWFPMLLLLAVWIFFIRQMQSGSGRAMGFGKSKAKMLTERSG
jgi:cell division protease FtsH